MSNESSAGAILAIVMVALVVLAGIQFFWFPFLPFLEQRKAGEKIVRDQMSAEKALQDYRWFRSQYQDIQAQRRIVQNYYDEEAQFHDTYGDDASEWNRQAQTRHTRLHQRITGSKNNLETMIGEYNARSSDATSAIWKCNLPYQVDDRFAVAGPPGSGSPATPDDKYVDGANSNGTPPEAEDCDSLPSKVTST